VYAGTYEGGLAASGDSGRTWTPVAGVEGTVRSVAVTRDAIYASVDDVGVLKSTDRGASWKRANRGLASPSIVDAIVPAPHAPSTLFAVSGDAVAKSADGGASWKLAGKLPLESANALALDPARPGMVYVAGERLGVSADRGRTWRTVRLGGGDFSEARGVAVDPRTGDVYVAVDRDDFDSYARVGDGVYVLRRGAARAVRTTAGLPRLARGGIAELRAIAASPRGGRVVVATNAGLYELAGTRAAPRWRLADPAFAGRTVRRVAFAPDGSVYAAAAGRLLVSP
jgi:photosystem II stability/assembly factor-like uncharacterized protein